MFQAFQTALSALSAHATAVDVVGNNLANLNTPGFKASTVCFRDLVTQWVGSALGETQVGFGTGRPFTMRLFNQGAIQSSSDPLDAAIQGDGFFVLRNSQGGIVFTRAGNFLVDAAGYLVTPTGERVQGWMEDANGVVKTNTPIGDIRLPLGTLKTPVITTRFALDVNLNAGAVAGQPDGSFSTTVEVVDSLGCSHVLTVTFTKKANAGEWDYEITIPGADVGSNNAHEKLASGTIKFDSNGQLSDPPASSPAVNFKITGLANGAADMTLDWLLYTPQGVPRLTQYQQISAVSSVEQDGVPAASLIRVAIGDGGRILAQYSNGQQRVVGQLALAAIRNPDTLISLGDNNFQTSARTALPAIGLPDTGGRGKVVGGALESSTADIAKEFTSLIIYQRGYQANARVVTTADELSQDTINLKR